MTSSLTQAQTARQAAATRRAEFLLECFQRQEQLYKDRLSDVTTASERAELLMEDALLQLEVQRLQKVRALEERIAGDLLYGPSPEKLLASMTELEKRRQHYVAHADLCIAEALAVLKRFNPRHMEEEARRHSNKRYAAKRAEGMAELEREFADKEQAIRDACQVTCAAAKSLASRRDQSMLALGAELDAFLDTEQLSVQDRSLTERIEDLCHFLCSLEEDQFLVAYKHEERGLADVIDSQQRSSQLYLADCRRDLCRSEAQAAAAAQLEVDAARSGMERLQELMDALGQLPCLPESPPEPGIFDLSESEWKERARQIHSQLDRKRQVLGERLPQLQAHLQHCRDVLVAAHLRAEGPERAYSQKFGLARDALLRDADARLHAGRRAAGDKCRARCDKLRKMFPGG